MIEFFYPGGFAPDYEFTSRALGLKHYGMWDDTHFTYPDIPQIAYPEGFQGNEIPLSKSSSNLRPDGADDQMGKLWQT